MQTSTANRCETTFVLPIVKNLQHIGDVSSSGGKQSLLGIYI